MHPLMKTQLENLHIDSVDLCNQGANQYADIRLFKSAQGKGGNTKVRKNWLERLTEKIHKSDAQKIEEYVSPKEQIAYISKCLAKSFDTIADAEDLSDSEKSAALVESTAQCMDFLEKASEAWLDTDEDLVQEEMAKEEEPYVAPVTEEPEADIAVEQTEEPIIEEEPSQDEAVETQEKAITDLHIDTPAIAAEEVEEEDFMKYSDFDIAAMEENDRKNLEELTKKYCKKSCFGADCQEEQEMEKGCCGSKKVDKGCCGKKKVGKGCEGEECEPEIDVMDNPIIAKALTDLEVVRAEHAALCKELEMRDMREIAKSYECTGQNVDELTDTLYNLRKSGRKAFDDHIQLLDQMKKNYTEGVFKTYGSDKAQVISNTNVLDQAVADIRKSNPDLSYVDAIVRAYQENPELPEYE